MTSIEDFTLNVKVSDLRIRLQLLAEKLVIDLPAKDVGSCEICGKRAELEKVEGYAFEMCPHCAYMTKVHATESHDNYSN